MATRDSYASSKAIGEFYVMNFCKENNIDFLIIEQIMKIKKQFLTLLNMNIAALMMYLSSTKTP